MNDTPDRLERLWGRIENLSPDQVRERIRLVRQDRRMAKQRVSVKKKTILTSDTAREKASKLLGGMDEATRARLLRELDNG